MDLTYEMAMHYSDLAKDLCVSSSTNCDVTLTSKHDYVTGCEGVTYLRLPIFCFVNITTRFHDNNNKG